MKNMLILILYWLPLIASTTQETYPPGTILEVTKDMRVDSVSIFKNDILVVDRVEPNDTIIANYNDSKETVQIKKGYFYKLRILNFTIGDKIVHLGQKGEITLLNPLTVNLDNAFLGEVPIIVWTEIQKMGSEKEEKEKKEKEIEELEKEEVKRKQKKKEEVKSLTKESLVEQKKLLLILDLDETMIGAIQSRFDVKEDQYDFTFEDLYVSLREGWKPFLETISKKYIIGVYTTAVQDYAEAVVKQLDPDRVYITAGVYSSRNGCKYMKSTKEFHKYMKHRVPDNMIQIVDDKPMVWANGDQSKVHRISQWNPHRIIKNYKDKYGNVVDLLSVQKKLVEFHETFFNE